MIRESTRAPGESASAGSDGTGVSLAPVAPDPRTGERLVALLLAGIIAWTYPVLFLFGVDARVAGIPLLFLYLYASWGLFVGTVALIMEMREAGAGPRPSREGNVDN